MRETKEAFKNRLIDIRIKNNLSRLEVAIRIKTSEDCISRIERGKQKILLDEHASRLAELYNVTLNDILVASRERSEI